MGFKANKKVLSVNLESLSKQGIGLEVVGRYIPEYIYNPEILNYGWLKNLFFKLIKYVSKFFVWLFLTPRGGDVKDLGPDEVEAVYNKESRTYNTKHHLTTRGKDAIWRRQAGFSIVSHALGTGKKELAVLDICTGTGETIRETSVLHDLFKIKSKMTGLDYCAKMLAIGQKTVKGNYFLNAEFVRGDATNMLGKKQGDDFVTFNPNSFDVVTQMFGVGGVPEPIKEFYEVLSVLKNHGHFYLIDMHKPIPALPGEYFFLFKWFKMPVFETVFYEEVTEPYILNRLWAWRDTTKLFYLVRLITIQDKESGKYFGFKLLNFEYEPQRWWFSLPVMSVGKIVLEKIEISKEEASQRMKILSACTF